MDRRERAVAGMSLVRMLGNSSSLTSRLGQLERFTFHGALDPPSAEALGADAEAADSAGLIHLDPLEVGQKPPLGFAGDLSADAAQVLGLAAADVVVADDGLFAADFTFHAHRRVSSGSAKFERLETV